MQTQIENTTAAKSERDQILDAMAVWIAQKPGLEFGNYGDVSSYRSELRSITKDLHHARTLLAAVRWRTSIDAEALKTALRGAFSGRLSWKLLGKNTKPHWGLSYCTGQYWPTEYRRAVCAVLASALWDYWREAYTSARTGEDRHQGAGDSIRKSARKEFGRAIASRWFQ